MRTAKKRYQVKRKNTILKNRIFWWGLLVLATAGGLFYLAALAPFFQIKKILIFGQEKIAPEQVLQIANASFLTKKILFFESQSIFLIKTSRLKALIIKKFPIIEGIKIKRLWPDSLGIEIKERQAIGAWCRDIDCFNIDKIGVIFEPVKPGIETGIIVRSRQINEEIELGIEVIEPKTLSLILDTQKRIAEKTNLTIKEFYLYENENRLNAKTEEGWQVYFDLEGDLNWQILELELLLEKTLPLEKRHDLEYIDLRFNKVFYK
ncbi:MAG: FtsQ-type POTRA domain-containing protein [bacterium]|nr:FtsQ-type POTRA domain-containing protein [bacterium]